MLKKWAKTGKKPCIYGALMLPKQGVDCTVFVAPFGALYQKAVIVGAGLVSRVFSE